MARWPERECLHQDITPTVKGTATTYPAVCIDCDKVMTNTMVIPLED